MLPTLPLALSLAGLARDAAAPWSRPDGSVDPRAAIAWAAAAGPRAVTLDAALDGLRPRQLDRSARRDLAAILRRAELALVGVDLWIPPEHFADPVRAERALDAAEAALELAADLSPLASTPALRPVVSVTLPETLPVDARTRLAAAAERTGSVLADHRVESHGLPGDPIRPGVDPATVLLAGQDVTAAVTRAGASLACARLSDASPTGRILPGDPSARLDLLAYAVALTTVGHPGPAVIDLRGLRPADQLRAPALWASRLRS